MPGKTQLEEDTMAKKKRRPDAERQPAVPEKDITQPVPDEPDDAPADLPPAERRSHDENDAAGGPADPVGAVLPAGLQYVA